MENQVKIAYSFDPTTIKRIMDSFFHTVLTAALFGAISYGLKAMGNYDTGNAETNSILVFLAAQLYVIAKEWITGVKGSSISKPNPKPALPTIGQTTVGPIN